MASKSTVDGVQYLRAIAALMVVGHHARHYFGNVGDWTNWGARGVDIFFVISGFVMALSTERFNEAAPRGQQASAFLLHRLIRVVPLYWIALLWTYKSGGESLALRAMDFGFLPRWNDHQQMVAPAFTPGWTINYEMLFYLLFAASMFFGRLRYAAVTVSLLALALAGMLHLESPTGMFLTSSVVLEFLFGIGVFFLSRSASKIPRYALLIVASCAIAAMAFQPRIPPGVYYGSLAAVTVWSTVHALQGIRLRLLAALGDASYSIYLFHLATFRITGRLCEHLGLVQRSPLVIALVITAHVSFAVLAGLLIHRFIEKPLLNLLRRRILPIARTAPAHG